MAQLQKKELSNYMKNSDVCNTKIIPEIVQNKVKEYEKSEQNKIRSIRTLYEGGLMSKREYTAKRNCGDSRKDDENTDKSSEFMTGCKIPKVVPYKRMMSVINGIDIGLIKDLDTLAEKWALPSISGSYRPLKPFLLKLADFYLDVDKNDPCLHWFNGEKGIFYVTVGADGAPFGKDNNATGKCLPFYNNN